MYTSTGAKSEKWKVIKLFFMRKPFTIRKLAFWKFGRNTRENRSEPWKGAFSCPKSRDSEPFFPIRKHFSGVRRKKRRKKMQSETHEIERETHIFSSFLEKKPFLGPWNAIFGGTRKCPNPMTFCQLGISSPEPLEKKFFQSTPDFLLLRQHLCLRVLKKRSSLPPFPFRNPHFLSLVFPPSPLSRTFPLPEVLPQCDKMAYSTGLRVDHRNWQFVTLLLWLKRYVYARVRAKGMGAKRYHLHQGEIPPARAKK